MKFQDDISNEQKDGHAQTKTNMLMVFSAVCIKFKCMGYKLV